MVLSAGILLIIGGFCACASLFGRVSKDLVRFLEFVGFLVGIIILIVAVDYSFGGNLLYFAIQTPSHTSSAYAYMKYYLPSIIPLGVLLVSRPIKNIRWASLISLALGLLVPYFLSILVPTLSITVFAIVFLIAAVAIYTLLKFVEDIFKLVTSILAFAPIALAIGLINIYFGVLLWTAPTLG